MTRQLYTLLLVLAAVCGACSDDDDPGRDGGSLDRAVGPDADQGSAADLDPSRKKFESRIPGNNAVPGWVEDTAVGKVGVEAGYTKKAIEALINGAHDPYAKEGCSGFAKQDYINKQDKSCTLSLMLYLWEMTATDGGQKMFAKNKKSDEVNVGLVFETVSGVKEGAVFADDAPGFRAYVHRGPFIAKIFAQYDSATCKGALKTDVKKWLKVLSGLLAP